MATYTARISEYGRSISNANALDELLGIAADGGCTECDLVEVTNDQTGEVTTVWVRSSEEPEPYDAAIRKIVGTAPFAWAVGP